jgi:RNA polymerase sigma factor (sigma-70 family)
VTGPAVAHGGATSPDGVLVQEAAAGSGVSYGALYDRYATQVFNYCLRLTGSPDDAADATQEAFVNVLRRLLDDDRPVLDFSSYLFAAARNESYSLMRQRVRTHPSESPPEGAGRVVDVETDPERAALLRDTQEAVQEANAKLAPRHREALALREVAGRSYDEVAEIMGITPNAAAQLIWRARAKLRVALTAGAVASVVATSEDCEWAQLLLSKVQDGEAVDEAERVWLEEHLDECASCQTANRMLLEAGASYRLWLPVALLAGMRADTLTAAGGVIGADWSGVAASGQAAAGSSAGGTAGVAAVASAVVVAAGIAFITLTGDDKTREVSSPAERPAAEAPAAPAKGAPARPDRAKAAARSTTLLAARAPGAAPATAKPPASKLQPGTPSETPPSPRQRPRRPNAGPVPPPDTGPPPAEPLAPQPRTAPPEPPARQAPPVAPSTPPPSECNWAGGGKGPTGCPPGHGGLAPGHGGSPPGLGAGGPPGLRGGGGPPGLRGGGGPPGRAR